MSAEKLITRESLSKVESYDKFFDLRQSLSELDSNILFEKLFPLALDYEIDGPSFVAAMLLIEFDPVALRSCEELLSEIADSKWYLSDKYIPFYLVTNFGKQSLIAKIDELLSSKTFNYDQRTRLEGIKYWAVMPAASLSADFTYFEWQEAIEGKNA